MNAKNISQTTPIINPNGAIISYRNRTDRIKIADIAINARGDIVDIANPIANLACFANPTEYYRGEFDEPRNYKGHREPKGCAMCPSRPACGTFVYKRVEADPELAALHKTWESDTRSLTGGKQYQHPTFLAFATACDARAWRSVNDERLAEARKKSAKATRKATAGKRKADGRHARVVPERLAAIDRGADDRRAKLAGAVKLATGKQTWLRNLPDRSIDLTVEAWRTRERLRLEYQGKVKGSDIARAMIAAGNGFDLSLRSLNARVLEALERIGRLQMEPEGAPVWPADRGDRTAKISPNTVVLALEEF